MKRQKSENRRVKRYLLRKGSRKDECTEYVDNLGNEYPYKWVAQLSSFYNIIMGCFRNGFPVAVNKLWYNAWAFYPFFFFRKDLKAEDTLTILNHERIHVRQQRDIHLLVSVPIMAVLSVLELLGIFDQYYLLLFIPFIPTVFYGIDFIRSWVFLSVYGKFLYDGKNEEYRKLTWQMVRENTCFEREAIMRSPNLEYLYDRKFMAHLSYL